MGDGAEMVPNGLLCQECARFIDGDEPGYPRLCEDCEPAKTPRKARRLRSRVGPYRRRF